MNSVSKLKISLGLLFGAFIVYSSTVFFVDETEYAIKIRLGDPVDIYTEPGLHFKLPYLHKIFKVDNRLLTYDADPGSIFTKDKKEMIVDNYAKWRVSDPLVFYRTMRNIAQAQARLTDIIYSQVRKVLGGHTMTEIVTGKSEESVGNGDIRQDLLQNITLNAREEAKIFGIEILDVRIKRADLPSQNSLAVYGRMEAERRRDAKRFRSEGEERSLGIKSAADRDRLKIVSTAEKESEEIRGRADAISLKIYAEAYSKDFDFFKFQRSHDAYRKTLKEGTTLLLSSERDFFQAFK